MASVFENGSPKSAGMQENPHKTPQPRQIAGRPKEFWDKILAEGPAVRKAAAKPEIKNKRMSWQDLVALRYLFSRDNINLSDSNFLVEFKKISWHRVNTDDFCEILGALSWNRKELILSEAVGDFERGAKEFGGENITEIFMSTMRNTGNLAKIYRCVREDMYRETPILDNGRLVEMLVLEEIKAGNEPRWEMLMHSKDISTIKIKVAIRERYLQVKRKESRQSGFYRKWGVPGHIIGAVAGAPALVMITQIAGEWRGTTVLDYAYGMLLGAIAGNFIGAAAGALLGAATMPFKGFFRARNEKKRLNREWLGRRKEMEGDGSG